MKPHRIIGSALAGLAATLFMEYASTWISECQSDQSRQREEQLRTEMPTTTLVRKLAAALDSRVEEDRAAKLGMLAHYSFGAAGGPAALLSRDASPLAAGLGVGAAMSLVVDEGANTVLGLTAPPREWPWQAHARGFAAHLVCGTALGLLLTAARMADSLSLPLAATDTTKNHTDEERS